LETIIPISSESLLVGMVSSCFITNMKQFLELFLSSDYAEDVDVNELWRSTPPHPVRCPEIAISK